MLVREGSMEPHVRREFLPLAQRRANLTCRAGKPDCGCAVYY